jgi:hypothetical protein
VQVEAPVEQDGVGEGAAHVHAQEHGPQTTRGSRSSD